MKHPDSLKCDTLSCPDAVQYAGESGAGNKHIGFPATSASGGRKGKFMHKCHTLYIWGLSPLLTMFNWSLAKCFLTSTIICFKIKHPLQLGFVTENYMYVYLYLSPSS